MSDLLLLCVEDEPEVREALMRDLTPLRDVIQIEEAEDVEDARTVLEESRAAGTRLALILCDHLLPGTSGVDFLVALNEDPETAAEARKYLAAKVRSGKFVMDSLHQRRETVRRIAEEIAAAQPEFFDKGISRLKPMTMGAVAEKLGVHETTVGRAVAGKYVRTPQGVFELKFFFTGGLATADGGAISTEAVKEAVAKVIDREDVRRPLSDQAIAERLSADGIRVARRTVAKYREQLGLPPAHKRK